LSTDISSSFTVLSLKTEGKSPFIELVYYDWVYLRRKTVFFLREDWSNSPDMLLLLPGEEGKGEGVGGAAAGMHGSFWPGFF